MDSYSTYISKSFTRFLFLFLFLFLFFFGNTLAVEEGGATTNPFDFIRSCCNATLYPDICFSSLSGYATFVNQDSGQLARVSIGVSLVHARLTLGFLANVTQKADGGADSAVHDCSSLFADTVQQMRGSMRQMGRVGPGVSPEVVKFQLSNVQTWMSAALTNEETCTDGFQEVEECRVKNEVSDRVESVKEFTSNALALVNGFAASVGS